MCEKLRDFVIFCFVCWVGFVGGGVCCVFYVVVVVYCIVYVGGCQVVSAVLSVVSSWEIFLLVMM